MTGSCRVQSFPSVFLIVSTLLWCYKTTSLSVAPMHPSRSPTFRDLQKCITPEQMLHNVGAHLPCGTPNEGILSLSSTLLVRLSKQMVYLDNQSKYSAIQQDDQTKINRTEKKNDSTCRTEYQDWSWSPLPTVVQALVSNGSWEASATTIEAVIEGTKGAAILQRLCPHLSIDVWQPLIDKWQTVSEKRTCNLLPHQLSGLKWAMDSFQIVAKTEHTDLLPLSFQEAYDALNLPFCIRPGAMNHIDDLTVPDLLDQVDFQVDTIRTTSNKIVPERRETAWQGDEAIAPFQYSGKSMPRQPWSPLVQSVRDSLHQQTGMYYDGCLLNHYPDGGSGMRYHIDPDQGTLWDYSTSVVSIGATRRFSFREIQPESSPQSKPHVFTLFQGDCTEMFGDCQTRFQHMVRTAEISDEDAARASLVFKKTWRTTAI